MARKLDRKHVTARERRKTRVRKIIERSDRHRITAFKSNKYTYAQVMEPGTNKVLFAVSSLQEDVVKKVKDLAPKVEGAPKSSKSEHAARCVGLLVAEKCLAADIKQVVFNRNGNLFHGRVKAIADGAREGGLQL